MYTQSIETVWKCLSDVSRTIYLTVVIRDCTCVVLFPLAHTQNRKNVVYNYSDAEAKVREATSNDPWGPSSALMGELAEYTYHAQAYGLVMGMLWKRLNDHGKNWRHVYKVGMRMHVYLGVYMRAQE